MRSLRLNPELDAKLQRAAGMKGQSVSEFIRGAAEREADETLAEAPADRFADVAGAVHGRGGRARRSGEAFTKALAEDSAKR
ncbi:MAG: DUF1778 domain-containing protein [Acidimicrobiales bacterium]